MAVGREAKRGLDLFLCLFGKAAEARADRTDDARLITERHRKMDMTFHVVGIAAIARRARASAA